LRIEEPEIEEDWDDDEEYVDEGDAEDDRL
jgi:hypothetical protein